MNNYTKDMADQYRAADGTFGGEFDYNDGYNRIDGVVNRSNNKLRVDKHDYPTGKYALDARLQSLFRLGLEKNYNDIVVPKGRILAIDKFSDQLDTESDLFINTLTFANGGAPVVHDPAGKKFSYVSGTGLDTTSVTGVSVKRPLVAADGTTFSSSDEQLTAGGFKINTSGIVVKTDGSVTDNVVIPGNIPFGIAIRNEVSRPGNAFNGMMPSPIATNPCITFPTFASKKSAEANFWAAAYMNAGEKFSVGDLVKSDENGRIVKSPLSYSKVVTKMTIAEYEAERQQVLGKVIRTDNNIVPEGGRGVNLSPDEMKKIERYAAPMDRITNRPGEDVTDYSAYSVLNALDGRRTPERRDRENDLNIAGGGYYSNRDRIEDIEDTGVIGLTDGTSYKQVHKTILGQVLGTYRTLPIVLKTPEAAGIQFVGEADVADVNGDPLATWGGALISFKKQSDGTAVGTATNLVEGAVVANGALKVTYVNAKQGTIKLEVIDMSLAGIADEDALAVELEYIVCGRAYTPTNLDFKGVIGTIEVIFTL